MYGRIADEEYVLDVKARQLYAPSFSSLLRNTIPLFAVPDAHFCTRFLILNLYQYELLESSVDLELIVLVFDATDEL